MALATISKLSVGTTFSFTLNEAADVTFTFASVSTGRKSGRKCVKQTTTNRKKPKCTLSKAAGSIKLKGKAGANKVRSQGRLTKSKKLKNGAYTVTVVANDAAGQTSAAKKLSFTIASR